MPWIRPEDNGVMSKERDLLPWVLGGLSTAAVAIAIAAVSSHRAAILTTQPLQSASAVTAPAPAPTPSAASAPAPATASAPASATAPAPAAPIGTAIPSATPLADSSPTPTGAEGQEARPGQIWTCMTKGVKTFSNSPCGEKSALLEVGPINTVSPAAPVHYARAYPTQTQYTQPYGDASQPYAQDDAEQDGYEGGANSYTIVQGVAVLPRRRPEHHPHRPPYHHTPAPAPRKF